VNLALFASDIYYAALPCTVERGGSGAQPLADLCVQYSQNWIHLTS